MHGLLRHVRRLAVVSAGVACLLVPTAAQADPSFYESPLFGLAAGPDRSLFVADAGQGVVDADTGQLVAALGGINDVAPITRRSMWAVATTETGAGVFRITGGTATKVADTLEFENEVDPARDGTAEGSNPFDVELLTENRVLVADAAGNSLLVVTRSGEIDWVATFPTQNGAQAVPTSVAIGPDGAYYVGELTGAPFPTGVSRVWRVEPGTRHARCGSSPACKVVISGRTAIIDLQFRPSGGLYVAQLDDAGVGAFEGGTGVGGSVRRCNVSSGACAAPAATGVPILTAIAFRGGDLWGTIWSLVPSSADVVRLAS
jgi:hypothetical protein